MSNAEEIAFYGGHKVEQSQLRQAYAYLAKHMEHMFGVKLWFIMLEQFLMKYVWSGAGKQNFCFMLQLIFRNYHFFIDN